MSGTSSAISRSKIFLISFGGSEADVMLMECGSRLGVVTCGVVTIEAGGGLAILPAEGGWREDCAVVVVVDTAEYEKGNAWRKGK